MNEDLLKIFSQRMTHSIDELTTNVFVEQPGYTFLLVTKALLDVIKFKENC